MSGGGIVATGALEVLKNSLPVKLIDPSEVKGLTENPPSDAHEHIYVTQLRRDHFLQKKDGSKFTKEDYDKDPNEYESILTKEYLPYLTIYTNAVAW